MAVFPAGQTAEKIKTLTKEREMAKTKTKSKNFLWLIPVVAIFSALIGLGTGYVKWGWPTNWYADRDAGKLPATPQNDLIRAGWKIIVDTPRQIGKNATDPTKRFSGNNLACTNCHISAGLVPYAAPLVSTFGSFPMMADDRVQTLQERINGCMTRSMNGKPLPETSREMNAMMAYIQWLGEKSPEGVRVAGMGLKGLHPAKEKPDATRGAAVYASQCASCHGANGQGQAKLEVPGYAIPPLWGADSFNTSAGMNKLAMAAAFIRANMPYNTTVREPSLTEQQAWDVAAFMTSRERPKGPIAEAAR
jgi:thiosulfate dehydrogenase